MKSSITTNKMINVIQLSEKWYSKKTLSHAMRVAGYAFTMAEHRDDIIPEEAFIVGMAHDLIEDTDCPPDLLENIIGEELMSSVNILTKDDNEKYNDYINFIIESNDELAILVKRADMKDHLLEAETLTDKLKEKYYPVIGLFL